jgi:hypothetical protein
MSLAAAVALLQAALSLLMLVSAHPELGQSARDNAMQVSQQAIVLATAALASASQTSTTASQSINGPPVSSLINTTPIVIPPTQVPASPSTNAIVLPAPCSYNGQTYAEGGAITVNACNSWAVGAAVCPSTTYSCRNGQWVTP